MSIPMASTSSATSAIVTKPRDGNAPKAMESNSLIVVLGASGDLARKKTYPALFGLYCQDLLPKGIHVVGYARTKMDEALHMGGYSFSSSFKWIRDSGRKFGLGKADYNLAYQDYHKRIIEHIKAPTAEVEAQLKEFLKLCTYVSGQYDSDPSFVNLESVLQKIESGYEGKARNRVFYMALPPSVFVPVAQHLKRNNYIKDGISRIIVEKPFGSDLESSREMQTALGKEFSEEETFRIDHYLGKEMVKNILVLRFGNIMLDSTFNKDMISNVQITFKEPFGTEGRGGYFDEFGIIRDVMQNHLLQVLSILTMDRPQSFSSEDIRDEKVKVLRHIPSIIEEEALLGQYVASADGSKPGYLDDETVPKGSICPTFAAVVLHINSPRWTGVPFILKAGKALNEPKVEIRIQYKDVASGIFQEITRNELVIRIQPGEAIYMKMNAKAPGLAMRTVPTEMDLTYKKRFSDLKIPEAYEALILDAFRGDHSNFVRDDELDIAWKIFTPLLHHIDNQKPTPEAYEYGSRGPAKLSAFIKKNGGYAKAANPYSWPSTSVL